MSFTAADIMVEVREQIMDVDSTGYRYSDAFVLRKINQAVKRLAIVRPDLFTYAYDLTCVGGSVQRCPADSIRIMDVFSNSQSYQVKEVNQDTLDMMNPGWTAGTPDVPRNWMRYVRDPNRFILYPPPAAGDTVQILYAKAPQTVAAADVIALQDVYEPLIVDCTVWLLESMDAEHVESGRAKMFQDSFKEGYSAGIAARKITDSPTAGEDPKEVI